MNAPKELDNLLENELKELESKRNELYESLGTVFDALEILVPLAELTEEAKFGEFISSRYSTSNRDPVSTLVSQGGSGQDKERRERIERIEQIAKLLGQLEGRDFNPKYESLQELKNHIGVCVDKIGNHARDTTGFINAHYNDLTTQITSKLESWMDRIEDLENRNSGLESRVEHLRNGGFIDTVFDMKNSSVQVFRYNEGLHEEHMNATDYFSDINEVLMHSDDVEKVQASKAMLYFANGNLISGDLKKNSDPIIEAANEGVLSSNIMIFISKEEDFQIYSGIDPLTLSLREREGLTGNSLEPIWLNEDFQDLRNSVALASSRVRGFVSDYKAAGIPYDGSEAANASLIKMSEKPTYAMIFSSDKLQLKDGALYSPNFKVV